jgi:hypothetical protein
VEKSFYFNLRKDSYLISKVKPYFYKFELVSMEGCKKSSFNCDLPVAKRFLSRWRIARIVPALFSYGVLIVVGLYEAFKYSKTSGIGNSIPLIFLTLVLSGLLIDIIWEILHKKSRFYKEREDKS